MRNIPMFTTQHGVASLILESVTVRKEAFVHIQSSDEPEKLLEECVTFCRACGAERIYATGSELLEKYPLHTAIWQMNAQKDAIGETDAALFPLQEQTLEQWRRLYNDGMSAVDNAAWMSSLGTKQLLAERSAYFVHRGEQLLGIGKASGARIDAVVSAQKGAGADVVRALAHAISEQTVTIEVASTNTRAIALYRRLGFIVTKERSRWYQIF